ncbi:hypothetical protein NPIL_300991, partial [Nephila pilipes]
ESHHPQLMLPQRRFARILCLHGVLKEQKTFFIALTNKWQDTKEHLSQSSGHCSGNVHSTVT